MKNLLKKLVKQSLVAQALLAQIYYRRGQRPWAFGYSAYKFACIRGILDKKVDIFKEKHLPPRYGFRLDERAVEYPWVFCHLPQSADVILDAGSILNHRAILSLPYWQRRTLFMSTLAEEGKAVKGKNIFQVSADVRSLCYKDDAFDAIICLSTLEHVGMDNTFLYTPDSTKKENAPGAYLQAVREFKRVLKRGGTLLVSVPYGKYHDHGWFQIFDEAMVSCLVKEFSPREYAPSYFKYANEQWDYSDAAACREGWYFDIHRQRYEAGFPAASQCVACLTLTK